MPPDCRIEKVYVSAGREGLLGSPNVKRDAVRATASGEAGLNFQQTLFGGLGAAGGVQGWQDCYTRRLSSRWGILHQFYYF